MVATLRNLKFAKPPNHQALDFYWILLFCSVLQCRTGGYSHVMLGCSISLQSTGGLPERTFQICALEFALRNAERCKVKGVRGESVWTLNSLDTTPVISSRAFLLEHIGTEELLVYRERTSLTVGAKDKWSWRWRNQVEEIAWQCAKLRKDDLLAEWRCCGRS